MALPVRSASRISRLCGAFAVMAMMAACESPTPYQPATDGFGYYEQRLEDNRYRVSFAGNASTPRETVQNYMLYRAAQVTVESGHDWFKMVGQNLERDTRYYNSGFYNDPFYYDRHYDRFDTFGPGLSSSTSYPINEYEAFADILVFEGEKPTDDLQAYDARDVLQRLGPQVVRPEVQS